MPTYLSANHRSLPTKWIALLAAGSTLLLLLLMPMNLGLYDESVVLQGAVEVGLGHVPHRDFFWTYGPLQLWLISALFTVFGKTIIVARLYDIAIRVALVLTCGLTARRLGLRASLVIGVMLIETILLYAAGFFLYPVFPAALCALVGTLLLVDPRPGADVGNSRLIAAGVLTGLTALLRYDVGFLLLVAHLMTLSQFCFEARLPVRALVRQVLTYGVGVSLIFLPVAVGAWVVGAVPGFLHDILTLPQANYLRMRALPWPLPGLHPSSLLPLVCYVPFMAAAVGLAWLFRTGSRSVQPRTLAGDSKLGAALLFLVILFIVKSLVRVSLIHSMLALVPAVLLLAFLTGRRNTDAVWMPSFAVLALASLLIVMNALFVVRSEAQAGFHDLLPARVVGAAPAVMRRMRCPGLPALGLGIVDDDTYRAACYIASHSSPRDFIFAGAGRHDKLFAGNAALYFISNRQPATHWYHLEPGLQTQPEVQREMIADLVGNDVRLIVVDNRFDNVMEPNNSSRSSGVRLLDRFLGTHYTPVARFGGITILTRRSEQPAHEGSHAGIDR